MMILSDLCDVKTNFPDADFWLIRKGTKEKVGIPTKEYSPEYIGIKVTDTERILPQYLFYWFQYIHTKKFFEQHSLGTLKLVHIRTEFVKNLPVDFR